MHTRHFRLAGFLVVAFLCGAAAPTAASDESAAVQRDVETAVRGLYNGDAAAVERIMHPRVIKVMGGQAAARASIEKAAEMIRGMGAQIAEFRFPQPPEFFKAGEVDFVLVPTYAVFVANGQRIESTNFQLGAREKGGAWGYVDGARMTLAQIKMLFPEYPDGKPLPPTSRKRL
ncbi:MAG: hypothetical protein NW215_05025 [Hyphomicrobiales bacterium]|nr:hypothetical protein [Hyphomicrobiales bacterium]